MGSWCKGLLTTLENAVSGAKSFTKNKPCRGMFRRQHSRLRLAYVLSARKHHARVSLHFCTPPVACYGGRRRLPVRHMGRDAAFCARPRDGWIDTLWLAVHGLGRHRRGALGFDLHLNSRAGSVVEHRVRASCDRHRSGDRHRRLPRRLRNRQPTFYARARTWRARHGCRRSRYALHRTKGLAYRRPPSGTPMVFP
jgi:hypothetical protein